MLGIVFSLAVVIGGVIGSGILRAPGVVAKATHSDLAILALWVGGGALAALSAMPLVEAGASVPKAGGSYPIAARAFGSGTGLITGWLTWLQYVGSNAFIAVVFAEYVHRLGLAEGVSKSVVACGVLLAFGALNLVGTRLSGASQSLASAIKGAAFVVLVIVLFAFPSHGHAPPPSSAPLAPAAGVAALIMAVRVIYQTYGGWDAVIYFSEEVERPEASIARATFTGIGLVTVIYFLVNAAILHVLPPASIAGSELAAGDAVHAVLGPAADTAITALGLFSTAAIINLQFMAATRITWRMARDRLLPPLLGAVSRSGAPFASVILMLAGSLILAATGSYESIVRIYAPWSIGSVFMICLSSIALRIKEPDLSRPYRMPLFAWIAIGATLIQGALIIVVVADDLKAGALSVLVAFAPLPIYLALKSRAARTHSPAP